MECTEADKIMLHEAHSTAKEAKDIAVAITDRVKDNETKYMDAVPKAHQAHQATVELSVMMSNMMEEFKTIHARNDKADADNDEFKERLFNRLKAVDDFVARAKAYSLVFVLIGLPLLSWLTLAMVDQKELNGKHDHDIPPAIVKDKTVKVKKLKQKGNG